MGEECKPRRVKLPVGVAITAPSCDLEIMQLVGYTYTIISPPHWIHVRMGYKLNSSISLVGCICGFIAQHHRAHAKLHGGGCGVSLKRFQVGYQKWLNFFRLRSTENIYICSFKDRKQINFFKLLNHKYK